MATLAGCAGDNETDAETGADDTSEPTEEQTQTPGYDDTINPEMEELKAVLLYREAALRTSQRT